MEQKTTIDFWALIELFGHTKIAGHVTEQSIGGTNMIRVDVPETKNQQPFTKFYGSAAIYSISPTDENTARFFAEQIDTKPIQVWDVNRMLESKGLPAIEAPRRAMTLEEEELEEE